MVEVKKEENELDNTPKPTSKTPTDPEHFRKLFIGGLSLNTTDEGLKEFYSQFGELLDCVVMRDSQTKKSRGFGFVTFSSKEEVDKCMKARPHELDGKSVDPKRAVPRDQSNRSESNISTKRLYVSGVREEHTEVDFTEYFNSFGSVMKVEIISDKTTGKPRGFAFVTFDDYDAVDQCVLQKSHMIGGYRCDVKKALSKDEIAKSQQMDRDRMERGGRSRGNQRTMGGGPGGGQWQGQGRGGGGGYGAGGGWGGPPAGPWGAAPGAGQWGQGYGGGYGGYAAGPGSGWGGAAGAPQTGWSGAVPAGASAAGNGWGSGGSGSWAGDASGGWGAQPAPGGAPSVPNGQWGGPAGGGWSAPTAAGAAGGGPPGGGPPRY